MNVISIHEYRGAARLDQAVAAAAKARKPLFVGEFGVPGAPSEATRRQFAELLGRIEAARVPLAALWVFDYRGQGEWNVTAANDRAWQLEAVAEANRRLRQASPAARSVTSPAR
jgi:hypothetical protein